jgi:hypothetical protein
MACSVKAGRTPLQIRSSLERNDHSGQTGKINKRPTEDRQQRAFPLVDRLMGGPLPCREPPIAPSGRQDLNLRPLDPQFGAPVVLARQERYATPRDVQNVPT